MKKHKHNSTVSVSNQKQKHKNRPNSPLNTTEAKSIPILNIMANQIIYTENMGSGEGCGGSSTEDYSDNDNDHLKINQNQNNNLNMKKEKKKFLQLKIHISDNKEIKSNTDHLNMNLNQENTIKSYSNPSFHRMDRQELFQQLKTPRQEEIGINTYGWFTNTVSKKDQKKLNQKLKKELKIAKTSLLKNLKQNENLPFFFCNDRIIAISSGSVLKVISELQTVLSVFNFSWSYPYPCIIKATKNKTSMKIRIIEANLENLINLIARNMIDHNELKKKKNCFVSEKEQLNRFSLELGNTFDELTTVTKKKLEICLRIYLEDWFIKKIHSQDRKYY